ncbi:MAG: hypothetical protein D6732_02525 [Methanobacteriota archaeon]|nr:MAG: hypothetical protein D6732_02525 [Euryarchaeota archaeon]
MVEKTFNVSFSIYEWYQTEETSSVNIVVRLILSVFILNSALFFALGLANTNNSQILLSAYLIFWLIGVSKLREKTNEFIIMSPFWLYFLLSTLILTFFNESFLFFIFFLDAGVKDSGELASETEYLKQLVLFSPIFLGIAICILILHTFLKLKSSDMFIFGSLGSLFGILLSGSILLNTIWLYAGIYAGIYGIVFSFTKPFSLERGNPRLIYGLGIPLLLLIVFGGSVLGQFLIQSFFDDSMNP